MNDSIKIEIEVSKKFYDELTKFLHYKKLTGNLLPDLDPADKLALLVVYTETRKKKNDKHS